MAKTPTPSPDPTGASLLPADDATADHAQQIAKAVHDLRNGLNALLMNAAVLAARGEDVPESLRPFVAGISRAGTVCSEQVTRLFALVGARRG
jgi:signal transduction histidine kinase